MQAAQSAVKAEELRNLQVRNRTAVQLFCLTSLSNWDFLFIFDKKQKKRGGVDPAVKKKTKSESPISRRVIAGDVGDAG